MARGRKASFTLVELLVVIGIIALLAALLLPVLAQASASARSARCRSKLQQYSQGIRMYLNNNEDFFPPAWHCEGATPNSSLGNLSFHRFLIHEYCESNFKHTYNDGTVNPSLPADTEDVKAKFKRDQIFWEDPAAGWTKDYFASFLTFKGKETSSDPFFDLKDNTAFDGNAQYSTLTKDVASTERPLLSEANASYANNPLKDPDNADHQAELTSGFCVTPSGTSGTGPAIDPDNVFVGVGPSIKGATSSGSHITGSEEKSRFDPRHNGSSNFLYADGHVESVAGTNKERLHRVHERWNNTVPANN